MDGAQSWEARQGTRSFPGFRCVVRREKKRFISRNCQSCSFEGSLMPLAKRTTLPGQGANFLATRRAAYEPIQVTLDHLRPTLNGRAFYTHLKALGVKTPEFFYPVPAPHPRYRIPFWNIAPGDQVRIREGAITAPSNVHGKVGTVLHVDRLYNRVFLKERVFKRLEIRDIPEEQRKEGQPDSVEVEIPRGILYGDLQLIIGKYDLAVKDHVATLLRKTMPGQDNASTRRLVALRVTAVGRRWDRRQLRFLWDRIPGRVRALKPGSGELEPWLVPTPRDPSSNRRLHASLGSSPKRIPWPHEEGYRGGTPKEGTIAVPAPPYTTPVFDTSPADALRATWEPRDLRALWASDKSHESLRAAIPEMQPRYDPEFGNRQAQKKRQRLVNSRIRYRVRRYLRSRRYGWLKEKVLMPRIGGYRGPNWAITSRPPNKIRAKRIAEGKDPDRVYGAETGRNKFQGYGGRRWPT